MGLVSLSRFNRFTPELLVRFRQLLQFGGDGSLVLSDSRNVGQYSVQVYGQSVCIRRRVCASIGK